jgi:hypothetical protein
MTYDQKNHHEQYTDGRRCGMQDASDNKPPRVSPCSPQFEAGYVDGYEAVSGFTVEK